LKAVGVISFVVSPQFQSSTRRNYLILNLQMTQPEAMALIARFDPRQQGLPRGLFPGKQSDYLP
jgi:hypothetical protein